MNSNADPTQTYYNLLAGKYDQATENEWHAPNEIERLIDLSQQPFKKILDIGIGTGQSIDKLYKKNDFDLIEGIDVSQAMLEVCKNKFPNIVLHHGDFLEFQKFSQKHYDLIICCGALEFISDLNRFLDKCLSLMHSKSQLLLTYEPRIEGHAIQSAYTSEAKSERIPDGVAGFMTYRYDPDDFRSRLLQYDVTIKSEKLFVSYNKLGKNVIYFSVQLEPIK